jgi:RNA polymerase sigma factor (sigma-70 family)
MTDAELLSAFRATGDRSWLGDLLERYTLLLLGVCMKYLKDEEAARDMVQQVHLKALTEWEKYPVEYVKSWLYTVARNECLMRLRKTGKWMTDVDDLAERLPADDVAFERLREQEVRMDSVEAAMSLLPEHQRICIMQFYMEDRSYRQIAEHTGFSIKEVKSHLQNGKRNLRIIIEKKEQRDGR